MSNNFPFECSCGESFSSLRYASSCRKCRNYCVFGYCTHVVDTRSGEVVWGKEPTREEYAAAELEASARWEEERKQLEWERQMWQREGELYEAELARQAEEARLVAMAVRQDQLWAVQDQLMGIR